MITSEECGFAKPDLRILEQAAKRAKNFCHAHALMIGDRLETDIKVAVEFGIDSCWINAFSQVVEDCVPTHQVENVKALLQFV